MFQQSVELSKPVSAAAQQGPIVRALPGIAACAAIAGVAYGVRTLPGIHDFSPMIIAIALGILIRNTVGTHAALTTGIGFSMRRLLRLAIILLGVQLTFGQVAETGFRGVGVILVAVASTFLFTLAVGRLLGADPRLTRLIAAGTSICGASAVAAANSVVDAHDEDVSYAVACVTVFGSIAMFAYPLLQGAIGLSARDYGLWAGSSIHEIAQVVAATFAVGREAGDFGTVAKLTRVMTMAPMVFAMAAFLPSLGDAGAERPKAPLPLFVLGFIALVAVNSVISIPPALKAETSVVSTFLLTMALAAMGLETSIVKLKAKGLKPALTGAIASVFIASLSLILIRLT
ncbi:YeiH family protein [Pleomorphomonas sp. NRK KF1]|uniref:YeiH family protein n=1 Tax=Pleomorphomonas sp. NRK KF1 TaxID=2943000 RepID=UPI0020438795|nr:putative sulfate exporter family transporter [Pleomorphomonas sp. NRK KF1]MCM5551644.1 putative sulfate exporter family transporter [Pleomorphomonas sp. NRK KF1]